MKVTIHPMEKRRTLPSPDASRIRNGCSRRIHILIVMILMATIFSISGFQTFGSEEESHVLKNEAWSISITPSTLEAVAKPVKGETFHLSRRVPGYGSPRNIELEENRLNWELPDQKAKISMKLEGNDLTVIIAKTDPGTFTWPLLPMEDPSRALIWPHWEGKYIPIDNERWMSYLSDNGPWNTLEGLCMPFWGMDCGEYSLTFIVTNRFNNQIVFKKGDPPVAEFTHVFPPNHSKREYGFVISLGENRSPVEPAMRFRSWLIDRNEFTGINDKMKNLAKIERLKGAAQLYLWGDDFLTKKDVKASGKGGAVVWKSLCSRMIRESESGKPCVGKHIKELMQPETWKNVIEITKTEYPYIYLKRNITNELSRLIGLRDFYVKEYWEGIPIPGEAKELLSRKRSSLTPAELSRMNALLLRAAYSDFLIPVDQWGEGLSLHMLNQLKDAGFDRLRICFSGWEGTERRPEVAGAADRMGYLFGIYDSFHSIHDPKLKGTDATWSTAQFPLELYQSGGITRKDGSKIRGFKKRGYTLSTIAARPYVEERVKKNFKNVPYNYYFVDCDAYGQVFDDYTPGRMVTQKEDAMARCDRMAWISDNFGAVIGSEGGSSYSAPFIHVAEGMFLSCFGWGDPDLKDRDSPYYEGAYWPEEGPGVFFKPTGLKEKYRFYHFDPRFRLPLFSTVFHDSVISTSHWGRGNLKYPEEKDLIFLTQLLYQSPPLYHLNMDEFKKRKSAIREQYDLFSPLHRELGFSRLTDFSWLTKDRLVQRCVFDDRAEIVANFSDKPYMYRGEKIPAAGILVYWRNSGKVSIHTP